MATRGMSLTSLTGHMSTGPGNNGFGYGPIADGNKEVVVAGLFSEPYPEHLELFIESMEQFPCDSVDFDGKKIYGAVAYINVDEAIQAHAEQQGLFVIRATDDAIGIVNEEEFVPRDFSSTRPALS